MSNFFCVKCGTEILDSPDGYITECIHYPLPVKQKMKIDREAFDANLVDFMRMIGIK